MEQVDYSAGKHGNDEIVTAAYRHGDDTVQVKVLRNFYANQSYATASVLSAERTWTVIATEFSSEWHAHRTPLADVAAKLRDRAGAILG